jgi:hypothetical protein
MEVGMFNSKQCVLAAKLGLEACCIEASPKNSDKIQKELKTGVSADVSKGHMSTTWLQDQRAIRLCRLPQVAALETMLVGMTCFQPKQREKGGHNPCTSANHCFGPLDDIVDKTGQRFLLKVDKQGFEPKVFAGLVNLSMHTRSTATFCSNVGLGVSICWRTLMINVRPRNCSKASESLATSSTKC